MKSKSDRWYLEQRRQLSMDPRMYDDEWESSAKIRELAKIYQISRQTIKRWRVSFASDLSVNWRQFGSSA